VAGDAFGCVRLPSAICPGGIDAVAISGADIRAGTRRRLASACWWCLSGRA